MRAVILCAGYATRLYPITLERPKSLLEIGGLPIIDYILNKMPSNIDEVLVVSNNKFYEQFVEWSKSRKENIFVVNDGTNSNEERIGGVMDLWLAIKDKQPDDLLVLLGDNLFDFDLELFVETFENRKKTLLGVYKSNKDDAKNMGVVEFAYGKIISFEEKPQKPKSDFVSTGIYLFAKNDFEKIKSYVESDKPKEGPGFIIKDLLETQDVFCSELNGMWYDIGSKETYERLKDGWNKSLF